MGKNSLWKSNLIVQLSTTAQKFRAHALPTRLWQVFKQLIVVVFFFTFCRVTQNYFFDNAAFIPRTEKFILT